jgi:hypothetical protein
MSENHESLSSIFEKPKSCYTNLYFTSAWKQNDKTFGAMPYTSGYSRWRLGRFPSGIRSTGERETPRRINRR